MPPPPAPKAGEVLIRIHASAVNPADWKVRSGLFGKDIPLPLTLGFDFSGVIDMLGEGVTRWKVERRSVWLCPRGPLRNISP